MFPLALLAIRNLVRNRRRTMLAMGAVVVGLAALTMLRGFVNAVQKAQLESTLYGTTGMLQVHKAGYLKNVLSNPLHLAFADSEDLRGKIKSVKAVEALSPRLLFSASLSMTESTDEADLANLAEPKTTFLSANAVDPALDRITLPQYYEWVTSGAVFESSNAKALVVHRDVAGPLGLNDLSIHQTLSEDELPILLAPDKDGALSGEVVRISGILGSAVPTDKRLALAPLETIQNLLKMPGQITEYVVRVSNVSDVITVQSELQRVLGDEYEVHRWDEILPFIRDLLDNIWLIFGFVTAVFLLVIMLGIVNSMFMNVMERFREIGTMMALGVKQSAILLIFVMEGAMLGAVGSLLGLFAGSVVVYLASLHGIEIPAPGSAIKFMLRPFLTVDFVMSAFLITTGGSALVSVWPAWRASRLRPVEALGAV